MQERHTGAMDDEHLDWEWLDLLLTARHMGLTIEQIRAFIRDTLATINSKTLETTDRPTT